MGLFDESSRKAILSVSWLGAKFMKHVMKVALTSFTFAATSAQANGLCPFDEQGPLGCPEGTIWYAEYEVCLPPQELVG
jgi:hypothetical protein